MEMNNSPPCPNTVTIRRNPPRRARATPLATPQTFNLSEIPPFPNDDVLAEETPQTLTSLPEPEADRKIKVFLRIRPILSPSQAPKVKAKSVWPQTKKNVTGGAKVLKNKRSSNSCLTVNDSHSVTLSTPLDLQESKRTKSETYGGFSQVFNSDSTQVEVYEKMVKPIVENFLDGKSEMLAALGPSGSGKTHTVFGSSRDPGMVSLALRHIFKGTQPHGNKASRSFHMSVFEIYTERGKSEKLLDLLRDGGELSMQQSSVKGLQQVVISNVEEAESLISQSVLKRATAMTNTNSQSSRSQCIINIRHIPKKCNGVVNPKSGAVLTIIDLAGAEREKRTGNQGTRLVESNFINNTLMVFGLCLRSLLEHQKNPKKPLQKHFQNSLLTRYLREYLEGKKRMSLILTAKSADDDYLDTSYLLRQASPYMQIKYNEVEPTNMVSKKRHYPASSAMDFAKPTPASEHLKRMRFGSGEHTVQNDEKSVAEVNTSKKDASPECKLDTSSCASLKPECDSQTQSERSHIIMRNFAKALWSVLKQSNSKLKAAEMEIQSLKESIEYEKKKYLVLKKEFSEFKACCTWSEEGKVKVTDGVVDPALNMINCDDNTLKFEPAVTADHSDVPNAFELHGESSSIHNCQIIESKDDQTNDDLTCHEAGFIPSLPQLHGITRRDSCSSVEQDKEPNWEQQETFYAQASSKPSRLDLSDEEATLDISCAQLDSEKSDRKLQAPASKPAHHNALEVEAESSEPRINQPDEEPTHGASCTQLDSRKSNGEVLTPSSKSEVEAVNKILRELTVSSSITKNEILDPSSTKDVYSTKTCDIVGDSGGVSSCKPPKPKRTLMPSSSLLSRDFTFDPVDETEKLKGNKGTRKLPADYMKSKGSITLLHMLKGKSNFA
ncbi:PREDICTED: kinesin-like protein KIN-6 isoform X3 [Lupinus angustifolius]|uniref:kinesin-like protein KIN-6 isoform X3 n=1 Tax=Lupinus angustifolius TaxID=3871 RepID=UPI00092E24F1|nr:PREDICTED: kinesin-like protein KIN-6 isoform X3 [Lupinus angustifolius]